MGRIAEGFTEVRGCVKRFLGLSIEERYPEGEDYNQLKLNQRIAILKMIYFRCIAIDIICKQLLEQSFDLGFKYLLCWFTFITFNPNVVQKSNEIKLIILNQSR